jgi:hypothetical protein
MEKLSTRTLLWTMLAILGGLALALGPKGLASAHTPVVPHSLACADLYEPDDASSSAGLFTVNGTAQAHTFHTSGDVDWVTFPMTAGQYYSIATSGLISKTDTVLDLYDSDGTTRLANNDDINYPANLASQIITTAVRTGTYYVRVSNYGGSGGCGYGYNLALTAASTKIYLPVVRTPSAVAISGLEVTQSVQNPSNGVPLVTNRRTVLRVYAYSLSGAPVSNVRVSVAATRNGVPLLGSPLVVGPQTIPTTPSRATYASSFNVELPSGWLSNTVAITAIAYDSSLPTADDTNTASLTLTFNPVPTLDVMVVPIQYTHTPDGVTYAAPAANDTTRNEIRDWIMRAYPVSDVTISFHTPVAFTGDLRAFSYWSSLLDTLTYNYKLAESGPSGRVYYGLIPTTSGGQRWFSGGYSGLGWVGWTRAAIGLELPYPGWDVDQTGQTAAHEIGHNLGRSHAPCGGVTGADKDYPYAGGSIGQFGLDIPHGVLWNPATTYDLMGYCDPQWVSDYTYQGLYTDQRANGASVLGATAPGLFIRGDITATGQAALRPVYAFAAPLTALPAASNYQVELLDAQGQVVATYPVPVLEASNEGGSVQAIGAIVPQPAQAVARVRLVRAGQTVAEKSLPPAGVAIQSTPTVIRQPGGPITLTWSAADLPALLRYTADGGQTWTTLGVDVLGGQFTVDPATLPDGGAGEFDVTLAEP